MAQIQPVVPATRPAIRNAAMMIRRGNLVGFPTETVYGLGGDATNDAAIASIFEIKKRPSFNPLIVHVSDLQMARSLGVFEDEAEKLALEFWPGALTLVIPRAARSNTSLLVSAGLGTIALRVPNHQVAQDLISESGRPIAAPSANLSGTLSPTSAQHVYDSLGSAVSLILDGGPCQIGIESTVVLSEKSGTSVLRPGGVSQHAIEAVVGYALSDNLEKSGKPRSPGQLERHYAPSHSMRLEVCDPQEGEVLLAFGAKFPTVCKTVRNLSIQGDLKEAAANLFAMLRDLDQIDSEGISVMPIPEVDLGVAINDRLRRAAARPNEQQS